MRLHGLVSFAIVILAASAKAEDRRDARPLIEEAISAHGGEAALARWPVVTAITMGTFHGYEHTPVFFFKSEITSHAPAHSRHVLDGELNKQKFQIVNVLSGDRGWVKLAGNGKNEVRDFKPAELEDRREAAYVDWISTLLPLSDRAFELAPAGEQDVGDKPAAAVRVTRKGHRDVTLYFDKETHLLVKTETRSRAGTPVEGKVETFLRLHKPVEGVQRPMMMAAFHNGRPLYSHWVLEYKVAKAPTADMFSRPQ